MALTWVGERALLANEIELLFEKEFDSNGTGQPDG